LAKISSRSPARAPGGIDTAVSGGRALTIAVGVAAAIAAAVAGARARAQSHRYRLLLEHLPHTSVALFDHDLRLQLVVGDSLPGTGLDAEHAQGRQLGELVGAEHRVDLERRFRTALDGRMDSFEVSSTRDGHDYWFRVVPVREQGRITGGMVITQDISERRQAQRGQELAEGTRRLMIDAMNEAYVAVDSEGLVTDWNARATQLFGYEREEAIGRSTAELIIPPEDHGDFEWLIGRHLKAGSEPLDLRMERNAVDREGRRFVVELAAATLSHRGVVSLHTFMHDISDRKSAEREASLHARELEAIAEATGALARSTDPEQAREAICRAALTVGEASAALLFEPDPTGTGLCATASAGVEAEADPEPLPFVGRPSGAVRAFTSGEAIFVSDLSADPRVNPDAIRCADPSSAYWTPVRRGDSSLGVIVLTWRDRLDQLPPRLEQVMSLVSAEAAVAIGRAGLLDRLARMARTDDLTGLPNRRSWDEEVGREIARAKREDAPLTVAMVDLDFFKAFNDTHGHQAGDRLLKEAAGAWRAVLRETDLIARYGGEEFAIALPGCSQEEAIRLIERLRAVTPSGESCSAGIATWDREEQAESLLGRADEQTGRNRTVTV
jgi:diguanylate cyclase (GGDEF)-like protein/PAS domain S-box-containing protein